MGDPFVCVPAVEAHLEDFLRARPLPAHLREACRYALLGGGKRIRPVLVCAACRAAGGTEQAALPAAAALEMVHAFSLVHDDLPALDDDDLRRGRPTLHRHAGEAMAILAGDALLGLAVELLARRGGAQAGPQVVELARAVNDMIAGQVQDTLPEFAAGQPAAERLHWIHAHKTGALLRAACRLGGLAAGADAATAPEVFARLTAYGEALGVLFQAVDDLLDATGDAATVGKATAKDAAAGKLTFPAVYGIDGTRAEIARRRAEVLDLAASFGPAGADLAVVGALVADRDR